MGITAVTRGSVHSSHWFIRVVGVDLTVADETTRPGIRPLRPTRLPPLLALRILRMASVGLMPDRQIPSSKNIGSDNIRGNSVRVFRGMVRSVLPNCVIVDCFVVGCRYEHVRGRPLDDGLLESCSTRRNSICWGLRLNGVNRSNW